MHFNTWAGNSTFGGTLDPSILPVHEYISWVQYSSYTNGAFQLQWREEFAGSTMPSGWAAGNWSSPFNLSTHNPADVTFAGGIAVLSMTADNATGFSGTPPADPASGGTSGTGGTSGAGGASGKGGATGTGGSGTGGVSATGGTPGTGGASAAGGALGRAGATGTGGIIGTGGTPGTGGVSATGGATGSGGGSDTGGSSGTGGLSGTGGSSATGGSDASGGTSGTGGGVGATGSGSGCSCQTAGRRPSGDGALVAALLIATCAFRRRRAKLWRPS